MHSPGTLLAGRYRLVERVGGGGMGEVWRATDQVLGRSVAVKVMRPALVEEAGFAERFLAEARTMATITHRGVVAVHDYHGDAAGAFLVMEYVDGESLARRLHRFGKLDPARTMGLVAQAAEALQAAHDQGVVHRDVKPGNLLVTVADRVVLTDFGIARSVAAPALTATGAIIGTPSYLAPEQVLGQPATPRSDVYALGVVGYEYLAGNRPFDGENPFDTAMRRLREAPPPLAGEVPPAVRAVVERSLAADPERRFPSARDMAMAARAALPAGVTVPVAGPPRPAAPAVPAVPAKQAGFAPGRVPVPEPPRPVKPTMVEPAAPAAPRPARTAPPAPVPRPTPPRPPGPPLRPVTVWLGNLLLSLAGLGLLASVWRWLQEIEPVVRQVSAGEGGPDEVGLAIAVLARVGVGLLGVLFLLLAWRSHYRSRSARAWTFVLGVATLLGCPLVGLLFGYGRYVEPDDVTPAERILTLAALGVLMAALVALRLPPSNRFFRPVHPYPYYPGYPYYPYPPRR